MFIQIHTLTGYAGVLLNRDDTGMAKRITYGDAVRTRISSQFAKRKIRLADGEFSLSGQELGLSVRSRETFKREIGIPLVEAGHDEQAVVETTLVIMDGVFKPSAKADKERAAALALVAKGEGTLMEMLGRNEINVLSRSEISYLKSLVEGCLKGVDREGAVKAAKKLVAGKDFARNLKAVGRAMSLDVAMFGRMVTGDALSSVDAAVHVAHGLTVHGQAAETDFFTAVDDLLGEGGHLSETEITSPLLYGYYVVDVGQLLINLQGVDNRVAIAAEMVSKLVRLVSEHVVGAKKGGTAPYSSADLVLVELGTGQPRSLAEAFRRPTKPTLEAAVAAITSYLAGKDRMYGGATAARLVASSIDTVPTLGISLSLPDLAVQVGHVVNDSVDTAATAKAA